ncbi:MAG: LysR substrate-binding domain-containing protein, partial [Nevskiales bacterium]
PLLVRGRTGVTPTKAGLVAYRHVQLLLRQLDQAKADVRAASEGLRGRVSLGVVPYSCASGLVIELMKAVTARHPGILLHVHENFEGVLAADLLQGRMDLAFLYEVAPKPELFYSPLMAEPLCVVAAECLRIPADPGREIELAALAHVPLLLPSRIHAIRLVIEACFESHQFQPQLLAEVESLETLIAAVQQGLGATILPIFAAEAIGSEPGIILRRLAGVASEVMLFLCTARHRPPSEAVMAVHDLAADLAAHLLGTGAKAGEATRAPPVGFTQG